MTAIRCAGCHQEILFAQQHYTLRLDLFAAAGDLEFTEGDLAGDRRAELEQLLEHLAGMEPDQVDEETDRVFERFSFSLCASCRARWHDRLRQLQPRSMTH